MEADVVVADRLAPRELLGELPADVELIDVAKLPRGRSAQQEEINRVIVERALAGKRVVRFKGGDNFVFGRGYEEVLACREAGVPVTVIPGLTSPIAVPARRRHPGHPPRGRPRVHGRLRAPAARAPRVAGRTGTAVAGMRGTVVLMMAVRERAGDRRGARRRRAAAPTRRSPSSATARCRASAPCSPRSAPWRPTSRPSTVTAAGDHRGRRASSRWRIRDTSAATEPTLRRDHRPRRPPPRRLPRPARRPAAQAPRGRARAVPRRGREGRAPRGRGRLHAALVPDGAALARRAGRRARTPPTRPATCCPRRWPRRSPASTSTGARWPRWSGGRCRRVDEVLDGARSVLVLEDIVDHTNVGAIFRSGAALGLRRRAARAAVRRPALPALDQGGDGRGLRAAVDPAAGLVRRAADAVGARASRRSRSPSPTDADARSRRPSPGWTGSPWCSAPRATASRRAGSSPPTGARSSRCAAGIDSLNVAAATAVACYVTANRVRTV